MSITTKLAALACIALLSGCASQAEMASSDALKAVVNQAQIELPSLDPALRDATVKQVQHLLAEPLTLQSVGRIAVLNNPDFLADLSGLAINAAELIQAGLLPNPGLRVVRSRDADGYTTELDFSFDLFKLIFRGQNLAIAEQQANQQQQQVALKLISLLTQSRSAYVNAVVAHQQFNYLLQVQQTIDASAELANRMRQAGNYSELQQSRQLKYAAEIKLQLARSQQVQIQSREALYRQLGLWGEQLSLTLPEHLPALPDTLVEQTPLESLALTQRLDLIQAKQRLSQLELQLGLEKNSRFVRGLSAELTGSTQHSVEREVALGIELPLFDQGSTRLSKAEAQYQQAWWQAQALAINARSEVRESYSLLQSQYQIARHYQDRLVPLAKSINQQNVLRYNGMLIGVFELIADTQAQVQTVLGQMNALHDFYLAELRLKQTLWGSPTTVMPQSSASSSNSSAAAAH